MKKKKILTAVISAVIAIGCMHVMSQTGIFKSMTGEALFDNDEISFNNLVCDKNFDGTINVICTACDAEYYIIPDAVMGCPVKTIAGLAFSDIDCLESIYIGNNVQSIGQSVFNRSNNLKVINVGENNIYYTSIDGVLFEDKHYYYDDGSGFALPDTLITYPAGRTDETYTILEGIQGIASGAFCNAVNLKSITIPESVKYIAVDAFSGCTSLTTIYGYENSKAQTYAKDNGYTFSVIEKVLPGDANEDDTVNVRDCATIAEALAKGKGNTLPDSADFNDDSKIDVRDAAAIASALAAGKI